MMYSASMNNERSRNPRTIKGQKRWAASATHHTTTPRAPRPGARTDRTAELVSRTFSRTTSSTEREASKTKVTSGAQERRTRSSYMEARKSRMTSRNAPASRIPARVPYSRAASPTSPSKNFTRSGAPKTSVVANKVTEPKEAVVEKPLYPMRVNQYLAIKNFSTRRGGDELVAKKKVFINGRLAVLGDKVDENDTVEVRNHVQKDFVYYAYNKPRGIVTHSANSEYKEEDIEARIGKDLGLMDVFPIGRLDKDSYGLIILTNDGRVTDRLLNPNREHDKEYIVKTRDKIRESFKQYMEGGVNIEGYMTKPCTVKIIGDHAFSITITEGKKHQIRRMVVALFNETTELQRVRILNVELGDLKPGKHRAIEGEELKTFLKKLNL
jgi:23S rRNA pseudouridine2604 synthase